jgi:branched-chain amino acid transport system permease protein
VNFGQALFFGVAAYSAALLNKYLGLQPWATIPIGAIVAVGAGVLMFLPALRLRGPYLSLVTLAFPLILLSVIKAFPDVTGGEHGITGLTRLSDSRIADYYISAVVMTISVFIMWKLTDAKSALVRTGIILHAIREDEIAARASGINTIRYKMLAFAVGGFFAGIAGGLFAHFMRIAGPSTLDLMLSFQAIIWTVFGGIVSIYGAVVGVYFLYPLMELLRVIPELRVLIFAAIVIVILLFMPEGIAVWIRDKIERECPRCKLTNVAWRRTCRACGASLY